jgi:hypothetical protein
VLHRCWSPELARVQRLRDEIGAYTNLVVSSSRPIRTTVRRTSRVVWAALSGSGI